MTELDTAAAAPPAGGEALVRALMEVIAGRAPLDHAERLLDPGVLCHMGRISTRGTDTWKAWVGFIRSRGVDGLEPLIDRIALNPDGTLTAHGRFRGRRGGRVVTGAEGGATYRVEHGRIVEIWTERHNYELIFGRRARNPVLWMTVLAQMSLWSRTGRPARVDAPPLSPSQETRT